MTRAGSGYGSVGAGSEVSGSGGACATPHALRSSHQTFFTGGIFHDPSMIEGSLREGAVMKIVLRVVGPSR